MALLYCGGPEVRFLENEILGNPASTRSGKLLNFVASARAP
jgi:hypothetical protein